jgi:geranylgeranyl pyrophosphate synthase
MIYMEELKVKLEAKFDSIIDKYENDEQLKEMIKYSLLGGKRLRSIILYCLLEHNNLDSLYELCFIVELIHSCSLILDDLPCMDNDDYRRDKLAFHKKYSNSKSVFFVSYCFNLIHIILLNLNLNYKLNEINVILYKNLGIEGASLGQYLDLFDKELKISTYIEQFDLKTATFFNLSFEISNIFNKFDENTIKILGKSFGILYQIYDDILDNDYTKLDKSVLDTNLQKFKEYKEIYLDNLKKIKDKINYKCFKLLENLAYKLEKSFSKNIKVDKINLNYRDNYYLYTKQKIIINNLFKKTKLTNLLKSLIISIDYKDDLLDSIIDSLNKNNDINFKNEVFCVIHYSWVAFINSLSIVYNQDIFEIFKSNNYNFKMKASIYTEYGETITLLTLNSLVLETLQSINLIKNKKLFNYFYKNYYEMFLNIYKKNLVNIDNLKINNLKEEILKLKKNINQIIYNYSNI